jgi:hypothetical protein
VAGLADVHVDEGVAVLEEVSPAVVGGLGGSVGEAGALHHVLQGQLGLGAGACHHWGVILVAHLALPETQGGEMWELQLRHMKQGSKLAVTHLPGVTKSSLR